MTGTAVLLLLSGATVKKVQVVEILILYYLLNSSSRGWGSHRTELLPVFRVDYAAPSASESSTMS